MPIRAPIYDPPAYEEPRLDAFGPMVSGFEVEQLLALTVREWMPCYLNALCRRNELKEGVLPPFRSEVATSFDADRLRDDQFPAMAIVAQGISDTPTVNADGTYWGKWRIDLHAVCRAKGNREARRLAQWYAATIRTIVVQPHPLPAPTNLKLLRVDLLGERYTVRTPAEERTLGEGIVRLSVHVADITDRWAGPGPDCTYDLYDITSADVDVVQVRPGTLPDLEDEP